MSLSDAPQVMDSEGRIKLAIDILSSVLPTGAGTAANQALILAQLQLIEDLRDALQSVATDRLIMRGEDQLHSYAGVLHSANEGVISGAGGLFLSLSPAAGEVWVVTNISTADITSPTTEHEYIFRRAAVNYHFHYETAAFAAFRYSHYHGWMWMEENDVIRINYAGALANDVCRIRLLGHIMTLET